MKSALSLFYFAYFALIGVYVIFLPKVLLGFGYSKSEIGIIYFAAPFMRFLLPFAFKHFLVLNQRIYLITLTLTLLATILFVGTVENFWLYLLSNLLFGASMGVSLPYIETIALQQLSKVHYGRVRLWGSVGFILIALWLGEVLSSPYEALYYLMGSAFFTLVFGLMLLRYDTIETHTTQEEPNHTFSLQKYWAFWGSIFLMQVGFGGFYQFFTIYELDHGVSLQVSSLMWSFGVICEIVMLYFQGKLLQKNLLNVLQITILITALRWLLLYYYANSILITFASQSLHAFSFALYHTALMSYLFRLYPQKRLAQQFLLGIGFGLGGAIGSLLSGRVYELSGDHLFLVESIITLMAWALLRQHQQSKESI
jgi:PPP family 3-phenylpropionic acid transporter